ncbi:MAG: MurR/RpiR family transcriptional regulator [Lachnospiraceae bacterium]|jgi:RpiR family carbohydrate utilization transcriptional regulator|nr:MurR/RpiR family transcriptional regulator [Lachnospiraceae bacterium]RKJ50689.1 MurR/RpiR family transcriptional regulator [bacterium 1XD42-54]
MNCLSLIRQRYAGMSSVEKRIADCILAEPEKVMNSPLVYVAKKAKVSEGSVINFSNSLGYKGFSQLKINLAQYVSTYSVHDEVTREDSPKQILRKLINRAIVSFESTYDTIGQELQSATDLLSKAGKIVVVGVGHSMVIAKDISIRMMWLGLPAIAETDPLLAGTMSTQMKENDVVFAVSNSGRTREVLMVAQTAHSLGVKVIGLTSYPNSPLAKLSDVTLVSVSMEAQDYRESTTARLTQLMIGDCLIDCLTNRISNEAIVYLDKRVEVYEQHRESIN